MPSITLHDIQSAADKKFGDFEIVLPGDITVTFAPVLRLPKETRRKIGKVFDIETRAKADKNFDEDLYDIYRSIFQLCERKKGDYQKLADVVGDDPAVWEELANNFFQDTAAGEA